MTKKIKDKGDERVLAKFIWFELRLGEDESPTFFAEFTKDKSEEKVFISEPNVDSDFLLRFLNAIELTNEEYKKRHKNPLDLDLMLSGFNKIIKDERFNLIGKLCRLTSEGLCAPYLIEPQNPEDGEPFNIREWRKKKRFDALKKR